MDITVTEIMEPADMHAYSKITEGTPAEQLPRNLLQHRMQQICTDVFVLQCKLIEARREIARLQAQLEAVGAGGVGPLMAAPNGWQLVPVEPTKEMKAAAVKFANGNAVYKNVSAGVLEVEEGIYGEAYEAMLAAAPQPPAQAQEDAPDMFWDADDTENFAHEVQDIVDGYCSGEIVTIECAKRMPNFRVLITGEGDSLSYEHIDAASAAQQGDKT